MWLSWKCMTCFACLLRLSSFHTDCCFIWKTQRNHYNCFKSALCSTDPAFKGSFFYCPSSQPSSNIWCYTLQAKAEEVMCPVSSDDLPPCSPSLPHAVHGVVNEAHAACTEDLEASPPVLTTVRLDKGYGWHISFSHRPAHSGYVSCIYMRAKWKLL